MGGVLQGEDASYWSQVAGKSWLKAKGRKSLNNDAIKNDIWDPLEAEGFSYNSLAQLENLQLLEYLWSSYSDASTNHHILLMILLIVVKSREDLPTWTLFTENSDRFSSFFRRVLIISLDQSLSTAVKTHILSFLVTAFQSLDKGHVRKECAPLVSISIWHNLSTEAARERRFEQNRQLKKVWRAAGRKYDAGDDDQKAKLRFERAWLYNMLLDFIARLHRVSQDDIVYCERFIELLTDLESQLPTRRYVNTLLKDLNILALINRSPMFNEKDNGLIRDLQALLRHYINFSIEDNSGAQYSRDEAYENHCGDLGRLQRVALKHFKAKLTILALANFGAIDKRKDLESHFEQLDDDELVELCSCLGLRTSYPPAATIDLDRGLLLEILIAAHEGSKPFQDSLKSMNILPTEAALYDPSLLRNGIYNGSRPLAIPKLNLQYLSVSDFLWRSFILYRCEQFFEIRNYLENVAKRLQPRLTRNEGNVEFAGFSRMALPISRPAILETAPAKVGQYQPAYVRAEITLNVSRLADNVRREWESLRPDDTIYLLTLLPGNSTTEMVNGHNGRATTITRLRTADVVQILDESGRPIRGAPDDQMSGYANRPQIRRLLVNLDAVAFTADTAGKENGSPDIYHSINVIVRRNQRENNFRKILQTIQTLALSDVVVPEWLLEVFLGYGDPASATFSRLKTQLSAVDFRDTFIDRQHLIDSFPSKSVFQDDGCAVNIGPPYVLKNRNSSVPVVSGPKTSKKRRRDEAEPALDPVEVISVSTYETPNNGPYPSDTPKTNKIRFTPMQIEAITAGTQPGLTLVVGPPGTGKTDVATQIISNIYHDFPAQRTLLLAHSNHALNQLFQKIVNLDIDGRHLLRLGQGESDLEMSESFGKYGRVESFLENRAKYLAEVDRLAVNYGAPGAHGNSCETAGYFNSVYNVPAWSKFWNAVGTPDVDNASIIKAFPCHEYFTSAPQPLFPPSATKSAVLSIAKGCERHISHIFTSLSDIRPFELLRSNKDKTNYLMLKEARIIAMTTTHAAMHHQQMTSLGFHYDNLVLEEAAQVTEIETFIPLSLQADPSALQRIVLCGDHFQNSPIIQNLAFRQYANLEQSLFLRLVRLGVPTITLQHQGRARPSIAELYKWRYPELQNLPAVLTQNEFLVANAGFRYEYQFIDVQDYKGVGEHQPSPHFFQNLGEAEYAVAIYQYMRLLGYPASKISILTTYAGQRALIRDVLGRRCANSRIFGMPRIVTTVDKYQGEQNDYVILSLVRTSRPGYLRDIRRLTVALSRARLGLYILGRTAVFETAPEMATAFEVALRRPQTLMLTTGEIHPTVRLLKDDAEAVEMTGVEHLGQYVYEMTEAKLKMLKEGNGVLPPQEPARVLDVEKDEDMGEGLVEGEEAEETDDVV